MHSRSFRWAALSALFFALLACTEAEEPPVPAPVDDDDSAPTDDDDSAPTDDDDSAPTDDDDSAPPQDDDDAVEPSLGERCFPEIWDPAVPGPDYEQYAMTAGSHCWGTDHQDISGVERVVFVGDSVTVGVPSLGLDLAAWGLPAGAGTPDAAFYRNVLVPELVSRFGLTAPSAEWWENWAAVDVVAGTGAVQDSGDFAICAKWGARNDDLIQDNNQLSDCIPAGERGKTTLVVMTSGGNDLASLTSDHIAGVESAQTWTKAQEIAAQLRSAMEWFRVPDRFPAGVFVIYGNMYEFTDGTGQTDSCPAAALAGFGEPPPNPELLAEQVIWIQEQYMSIAVDNGMDMIWMLEHFCGHGWNNEDPTGRCFRGTETERWFDLSCTHPSVPGHAAIAQMFLAVVDE